MPYAAVVVQAHTTVRLPWLLLLLLLLLLLGVSCSQVLRV
jgi:hypothetical protein